MFENLSFIEFISRRENLSELRLFIFAAACNWKITYIFTTNLLHYLSHNNPTLVLPLLVEKIISTGLFGQLDWNRLVESKLLKKKFYSNVWKISTRIFNLLILYSRRCCEPHLKTPSCYFTPLRLTYTP